jgi:DNA invertase Pin-like site-specific DNA recombinase
MTSLRKATAWPTEPSETAASYERVSRQVQALYGHGLKRQDRSVDELALEFGVTIPPELRFTDGVDDNASGARTDLPELDRCIALARAGRYKTLIVPTTDRWTRETAKGIGFTQLVRSYGVRVIWGDIPEMPDAADGNPYPAYWRQRMELDAFQEAQLERAKTRWRTMNGRRDKAAAGQVVGQGTAPYGYRYVRDQSPKRRVCGLQVYEPEAAIVRELYARALGSPVADLLQWLHDEHIAPPGAARTFRKARYTANAGARWGDDAVYRILTSRLYVGTYTYHERSFEVDRIVSEDTFERVAEALATRRSHRGAARKGTRDDEFLFRGRLVCEPCSAREGADVVLHAKRASRLGDRYYLCPFRFPPVHRARFDDVPRCELPTIRAEVLEARAWSELTVALSDPARLRADLADARERRRAGDVGREDHERAIETSIAQQERRLGVHVRRITELDAEGTPESEEERPIHEASRDEIKHLLVRLRRELHEVRSAAGDGVSVDEAAEIERLAGMVDEVGERATPEQRRHLIELLGLRARLGGDGEQVVVQLKPQREVAIEWSGKINLRRSDGSNSAVSFLKFRMQLLPSGRLVFAA